MATAILKTGYEAAIRAKLGVKAAELPDTEINQRSIVDLAEAIIIKRIPEYATITDPADLIYLENAVMSRICALLCPGMARRVNLSVTSIDVKWQKDKVDWEAQAATFEMEYENSLSSISTVVVNTGYDAQLFIVLKGPSSTTTTGG